MRRIYFLLVLLIVSLTTNANSGGFYYSNYKVDAFVHRNNAVDVTETMTVVFQQPRHGIYRTIPCEFSVVRNVAADGQEEQKQEMQYYNKVSRVSVEGFPYEAYEESGSIIVKIGSPDFTVLGEKTYVLHYTYEYADDRIPHRDYLLHSVLGADMNAPIEHFEFDMEFEKPLPATIADNLYIYSGGWGTDGRALNVNPTITANAISASLDSIPENMAVTLAATLPEGYYEGVETITSDRCYMFLAITIALALLLIVIELTTRHPQVVKTIEFYPPEGISSAEVGTIIDDSADDIDIASLIPWFASKGFIAINEVKKNVLEVTRLRDIPDDAPDYQKSTMKMLFHRDDTVRLDKLKDLGTQVQKSKMHLARVFTGEQKLVRHHWGLILLFLLMCSSVLTFWFSTPTTRYNSTMFFASTVIWAIPFFFGVMWRLIIKSRELIASRASIYFGCIIRLALVVGVYFVWINEISDYGNFLSKEIVALLFGLCFIAGELSGRLIIDTDYRADMMGRLLGFREFIKTAEKDRLESLQSDDPEYFYKVLPFALVFGLSDKWADQFKDITVQQPDWYTTSVGYHNAMNLSHLTHSLASASSNAITVAQHSTQTASHGSFGGGGFAGGGGGGGGGGSW